MQIPPMDTPEQIVRLQNFVHGASPEAEALRAAYVDLESELTKRNKTTSGPSSDGDLLVSARAQTERAYRAYKAAGSK